MQNVVIHIILGMNLIIELYIFRYLMYIYIYNVYINGILFTVYGSLYWHNFITKMPKQLLHVN